MSKALNLALLANNVNSSGLLDASAVDGTVSNAVTSTEIVGNNFSIKEVSGKLIFYYGASAIASMDTSGNFVQLGNVTAFGTP